MNQLRQPSLAVSHTGAWQGFTMNITRYMDDRLTVIMMTNLDENNAKPEKIVGGCGSRSTDVIGRIHVGAC